MRMLLPILCALLLIALAASLASACPMCKDSIPSTDAQAAGGVPSGFNNSIFYMLAAVFTLAATGAVLVVRTIRQTDRATTDRGFDVLPQQR